MGKPLNTTIQIADGSHNHQYELVFYEGPPPVPHLHRYEGVTSFDVGHNHRLFGVTASAPITFTYIKEQLHLMTGMFIILAAKQVHPYLYLTEGIITP